ncbi:MAG: hypothetical protein FD139_3630 [Methylocystaceae bacterium]|nr:MAG: hypothetical protein FD172_3786 [Methylocystaceae bacterium]TXT42397.1 MAG: hypothetical protein FD139_3630 [Methylocystaceae bacterium]
MSEKEQPGRTTLEPKARQQAEFGLGQEARGPFRRRPEPHPSSAKAVVVVLGMHRSGTSSLAGTLVRLGARAPETLMQEHWTNRRGFFESEALMHLNDAILASAGSSWDDWRAFNPDWHLTAEAEEFEEKVAAALEHEFGAGRLIVVKDPRICRMMPFWTRAFDRAGYAIHVALPVRSPLEVASSLRLRDGFPTSKSLLLWLRHVLDAEAATRTLPRAVLHWPDFLADWRLAVVCASKQMGIVWPKLSDRTAAEIDSFLTPSLRHNVIDAQVLTLHPDVNEWVQETYGAMIELAADPASTSAWQKLDDARAAFDRASRIFGRILVDFEENVARAQAEAAGARVERETLLIDATQQRQRADANAGERDGARGERDYLAAQLAEAAVRRDVLQQTVNVLTGERDQLAAQLTEAAGAHDALQHAVNILTGERDQLEAQLAEVAGARDGLQHAVNVLTDERDHLTTQFAGAVGARDALQHAINVLTGERAQLEEAADVLNQLQTAVATLTAERDSLAAQAAERGRSAEEAAEGSSA